jgi:amidase
MPNLGLIGMDAVALSTGIKAKEFSCREVMDAFLSHIERINPVVNAIVSLQDRETLFRQSEERDEQLARGEYLGWLHGFPQAVKDLTATKGILTTHGSPLLQNFVPEADAFLVERMRQETGDRRQETGDRRQETGDRRQETGLGCFF